MIIREIIREEIEEIRKINRSELVDQIYYYKNKQLILEDEYYEIPGWHPDKLKNEISHLYDIFDRNGIFFGAFNIEKWLELQY